MTVEQFAHLCQLIQESLKVWDSGKGRPRALTLGKAVKVTVTYMKNNVTQEFIAELMDVSQPTVSRTIALIEPIIAQVLDEYVPDPEDAPQGRVLLIDGTLTPCWSWADAPELRSGKHKTTGHSHQIGADLTGRLVFVTDPLPGKTHDARALRDSGLATTIDLTNSIGDKGYIGTGLLTPFRKPPGRELLSWQKEFNGVVNSLRAAVERAIANLKTWRILHTDYRRPLKTYDRAFRATRALHFFKIAYE